MPVNKRSTSANSNKSVKTSGPTVLQDGANVRGSISDAPLNESEKQLQRFEAAVKLFRAQQYHEARELFQAAIEGPQKEVSHNARLHVIMCDRRLQAPVLELKGLEDHYNYAIERINARDLECARKHLETAMALSAQDGHSADHLLYALAICSSLSGDLRGAYENLKRAIEIDPKNRLAARNDADFASVAQQPLVQQLLFPEKFPS